MPFLYLSFLCLLVFWLMASSPPGDGPEIVRRLLNDRPTIAGRSSDDCRVIVRRLHPNRPTIGGLVPSPIRLRSPRWAWRCDLRVISARPLATASRLGLRPRATRRLRRGRISSRFVASNIREGFFPYFPPITQKYFCSCFLSA